VTDALDVAIDIAARNVFENVGKELSFAKKAELLSASCNSLVELYRADTETEVKKNGT